MVQQNWERSGMRWSSQKEKAIKWFWWPRSKTVLGEAWGLKLYHKDLKQRVSTSAGKARSKDGSLKKLLVKKRGNRGNEKEIGLQNWYKNFNGITECIRKQRGWTKKWEETDIIMLGIIYGTQVSGGLEGWEGMQLKKGWAMFLLQR